MIIARPDAEGLRRDLLNVKKRPDPEASALQQPTDPHAVLAAMNGLRESPHEASEGVPKSPARPNLLSAVVPKIVNYHEAQYLFIV